MLGLPMMLLFAVIVGAFISNLVLSLSPIAGFAVIFGASAVIVFAIEIRAYYKRKPKDPKRNFLFGLDRELRQSRRQAQPQDRRPTESEAELADNPELIDSYEHGWVQ